MTLTAEMRIGSLFSGIGGLELGLERAGVGRTVWQVERDPYCRRVLARHWPDATRYEDVCTVDWSTVEPVEVLCGGFPCQDISLAGRGGGLAGSRSGLWASFAAAVRHLRPRFVVVENVAAILGRGIGQVLGDLAESGYDAEWDCIRASDVGAPHERARVFVVAYPEGFGKWAGLRPSESGGVGGRRLGHGSGATHVWPFGPDVCRGTDGLPARLDGPTGQPVLTAFGVPYRAQRLHALGNAVVPQVAEVVGRRLLDLEAMGRAA